MPKGYGYGKGGKMKSMSDSSGNPHKQRRAIKPKVEKSLVKNGGAKKGK